MDLGNDGFFRAYLRSLSDKQLKALEEWNTSRIAESPDDAISTLYDFEPIDFSGIDNLIDAAIALSDTSLLGNATPNDGYGTPKSATVQAFINYESKEECRGKN